MSFISILLIIFSFTFVRIKSEEKFCEKDRPLLLGGVFNYENLIFGYSWKEVNSIQLWLIWSYEVQGKHLVPIGKDMAVNQVFPGIPLFRAGFGLTIKCDKKDTKCQSYRQLAETDKSKIPWSLKTRGESTDWFFNNREMDNVNAIMFLSGHQSQIFIVSKNCLFVTSVSLKATSLKWTKLSENKELGTVLGGIVVGSHLFINKNEEPKSILLKYDSNGKQLEKISVWKYFECDSKTEKLSDRVMGEELQIESIKETDDNLAIILLICIVVAIVLVDIIVGAFWLSIYKKNNSSEV